jgi:hypothetical protein
MHSLFHYWPLVAFTTAQQMTPAASSMSLDGEIVVGASWQSTASAPSLHLTPRFSSQSLSLRKQAVEIQKRYSHPILQHRTAHTIERQDPPSADLAQPAPWPGSWVTEHHDVRNSGQSDGTGPGDAVSSILCRLKHGSINCFDLAARSLREYRHINEHGSHA